MANTCGRTGGNAKHVWADRRYYAAKLTSGSEIQVRPTLYKGNEQVDLQRRRRRRKGAVEVAQKKKKKKKKNKKKT